MSESDFGFDLASLAGRRYVVETLDALAEPATRRELRQRLHIRRHDLDMALRALASHGAIRRIGGHGSWDRPETGSVRYELTDTGLDLDALLSRLEVWTALYEDLLAHEDNFDGIPDEDLFEHEEPGP